MILGHLVIGASHTPTFKVPLPGDLVLSGSHSGSGRYTGSWELVARGAWDTHNLLLPHRDKHTTIYSVGGDVEIRRDLVAQLSVLDAEYVGQSQLQKYHSLLEALVDGPPFASILNTESTHSSFALLSSQVPISLVGVYDLALRTSSLVWATQEEPGSLDLVQMIRHAYPLKYLLYRFPAVKDRAVFIPTQATCAHWWKYMQNQGDPLFAFNALELKLFKNQLL